MGFREDLKVNKIEKKPNKKMMEKIEARKLSEMQPSNEKMMKEIEARKSRNCPEYDGDER